MVRRQKKYIPKPDTYCAYHTPMQKECTCIRPAVTAAQAFARKKAQAVADSIEDGTFRERLKAYRAKMASLKQ